MRKVKDKQLIEKGLFYINMEPVIHEPSIVQLKTVKKEGNHLK
jgi:hypothetical protein